jgi:hypothetical protein
VLVGTANASPAASDYLQIVQYIEGYRIARLAFGTATARPITLAFWVKAHRTGTYSGSISNNASGGAARFYTFTFTLSVADTWEYKTVTIPGDVTGTWQTTNVSGLVLSVCIMSGSTYLGTPNVWGSTSYVGATGQINGVAATSDVFYITGVVVLPGTQAPTAAQSPLIMRPYDQELMTCFRYWRRFNLGSAGYKNAGNTTGVFYAMTPMRSTPTISVLSSGNVSVDGAISRSALPDGINITFVAASVGGYILNEMLALDARL